MTGPEQFTAQLESGPDEADRRTTEVGIYWDRCSALDRSGVSITLEVFGSKEAMRDFVSRLGMLACASLVEQCFGDHEQFAEGIPTRVSLGAKPGEETPKELIAEVANAVYLEMLETGVKVADRVAAGEASATGTATGRRMLADAGV